jgi:hypothetical protein
MVDAVSAATKLRPEDCRTSVAQRFSAQAMVTGYEVVYRAALENTHSLDDPPVLQRIAEPA